MEREKNELEDQRRRDEERLERLMLNVPQTTIPQETVDEIIDHLYNDRRALKTCALVCRAWVPSSRYHLFSSLHLLPSSYGPSFRHLIGHLDHPLCTFASSVCKLLIIAPADGQRPILFPAFWFYPLTSCLAKLSSVTFLISEEIVGCQALSKSPSFASQITHLTLNNPFFEFFEECMKTIHSFPSLVHLDCDFRRSYGSKRTQDLPAFRGSLPPTLRALVITFSVQLPWSQLMWQWLHQSQTQLSTITLRAVLIHTHDIAAAKLHSFTQYLQFLGSSLEVLQVNFVNAPSISLFLDNVDMTLNTGLHVLELGNVFNFQVDMQSFDGRFSLLPWLLFRIPTAALTTIKFEFWFSDNFNSLSNGNLMVDERNTDATWMAIDKLLTGSSFSVLTEVAFRVFNCPFGFEIVQYLELKLAGCKQKGLLRISNN